MLVAPYCSRRWNEVSIASDAPKRRPRAVSRACFGSRSSTSSNRSVRRRAAGPSGIRTVAVKCRGPSTSTRSTARIASASRPGSTGARQTASRGPRRCECRRAASDQSFAEPGSLSSTSPANFPLPRTTARSGFVLLASRARRRGDSSPSEICLQGGAARKMSANCGRKPGGSIRSTRGARSPQLAAAR